jgi:hypothetical protein
MSQKLGIVLASAVLLSGDIGAILGATLCGYAPPAPEAKAPIVSGTPTVGQQLSTTDGTWVTSGKLAAYPNSGYTRKWLDCDSSGGSCSDISGATGNTYALRSSDYGHTIRSDVTATTAGGSTSQVSAATSVVTSESIYGGGSYGVGNWPPPNWEPYASTSPWNQQLPDPLLTPRDPNSANIIGYMVTKWPAHFASQTISNTPSNEEPSRWDHPLYWAQSGDPTYTINDTGYACHSSASTACPTTVEIPNGAYHALAGDGHLAVVQPDGHTEIDFWQVQNSNPLSGGGTLTVHAYGALDMNGAGCCGGSTAANQGLEAGQMRGQEMQNGVITHVLSVTVPCTNGTYVFPANGLARACSSPTNAPANGERLQLNMTDSKVDTMALSAPVKIILKAMIHYGLIVTDTGSFVALQWEPALDYTRFGYANPLMTYMASQGFSDPATISISLPWTDFQVVNVCYTQGTC